jgi:transposase
VEGNEILLLGLGIQSPWQLVAQRLDVDKQPHELHLQVSSERGTKYACPVCGAPCPAHDFQEKKWRHLNFFQHHCYIHASVPRVKPRTRREVGRGAVGAQGQCVHAVV